MLVSSGHSPCPHTCLCPYTHLSSYLSLSSHLCPLPRLCPLGLLSQLCQKSGTSPHPASRQIELDLPRTLTTNQLFSSPSSAALQQLRRILLAFSWRNPAIGYCQGLNRCWALAAACAGGRSGDLRCAAPRLAAVALLVLQSEEEAFWCLVAIVETIMPQDYYTQNLVASQVSRLTCAAARLFLLRHMTCLHTSRPTSVC